jgi:hypothetical protein
MKNCYAPIFYALGGAKIGAAGEGKEGRQERDMSGEVLQ